MTFQPFGYPFEVQARIPPRDVKAAIRRKKKGWFDAKDGPRGWIVGPLLCLWSSAFDQHGPMLFGLIRPDNMGTRVRGRAGSDLNGMLMLALLLPGLLYLVAQIAKDGQATTRLLVVVGVVIAMGLLTFWWAHKDRKKAEHLVRFIQGAVGAAPSERTLARRQLRGSGPPVSLGLGDTGKEASPTAERIYEALDQLKEGLHDFVILERSEDCFMQSAMHNGEFVVEMRDGGEDTHRHAVLSTTLSSDTVPHAAAAEALLHIVEGREVEAPVNWERGYADIK